MKYTVNNFDMTPYYFYDLSMYFLFHSSFYLLQTLPLSSCCWLCNNFLVNKENRPWRSGGKKGFWDMICVQCNLFMTENTLFVNLMTQNTIFDGICAMVGKSMDTSWPFELYQLRLYSFEIYHQYIFLFCFMSKWFRLVPADPRFDFTYSINLRLFNWESKH